MHEITWTREKASRFWQFMAGRVSEDSPYFSQIVGSHVISEAEHLGVRLDGRVLDYGCGPGHLLKHLIDRGVACEGADFDAVSLQHAKDRVGRSKLFRGTTLISGLPSSLPDEAFDVVFCIETVEHLIGEELDNTLIELRRIMRSGAYLVITTPNEEDLELSKKMCPDCGCVFHRVQHVSSWSAESLASLVRKHGFRSEATRVLKFRSPSPANWLKRVADIVRHRRPPHLILVAQK